MRLRHIEVFHAVYTCGSITAAAKMLNVSQPSVSKVLAHAEQQLGFALFDRQKGKIVPTHEAERLITHVNHAYDNISELRRISENLRATDAGLIRLAVTPAFGIDLVPHAMASYLAMHPDTRFEVESLHHHQIARALKEYRIDIGLAFDPPSTPGVKAEVVATGKFMVLTPRSMKIAGDDGLTLEDLEDMPMISLNTRSPLGELIANRIETSETRFHSVAKTDTYQMAQSLVAHGAGVAIIDDITAKSMGHDNVVSWPLKPTLNYKVALLHVESEPLSIVTQRFVDHLTMELGSFLE